MTCVFCPAHGVACCVVCLGSAEACEIAFEPAFRSSGLIGRGPIAPLDRNAGAISLVGRLDSVTRAALRGWQPAELGH
ncbi:hypothetical protein [Amycolatopsis sp. NPDC050768]|uniref:hypothetical protein n=1 Tax=Amycolatopsis sp. NPDC050768 TaxID=3154839 RepID=UPI0033FD6847